MQKKESAPAMTYFFEGPLSFSSMAAQAFLYFGFSHAHKDAADIVAEVREEKDGALLSLSGKAFGKIERTISCGRPAAAHALMDMLSELCGKSLGKWGYLLGMRPVKILFPFFADGSHWQKRAAAFLKEEKVTTSIADLLLAVGEKQRCLAFGEGCEKKIAFYIHIPFCPSHCLYCSFPATLVYPGCNLEPFTETICRDIEQAGILMRRKKMVAESIYMGGGTPSVLTPEQIARILQAVKDSVPAEGGAEVTVEAGRPDTITVSLLDVLQTYGVSRISVNPQTMQDHILRIISRMHGRTDIYSAFQKVRSHFFRTVNMDFICGLPEQTLVDVEENIQAICQLKPKNVTIHTLAIKRGSPFYGRESAFSLPREDVLTEMLQIMYDNLIALGYEPYYLYRQKYMKDDFANVGYTLPGHEGIYNIQVMGERQHVIGVGPGSVSKAVMPGGFHLRKLYMPRQPDIYVDRLSDLVERRNQLYET